MKGHFRLYSLIAALVILTGMGSSCALQERGPEMGKVAETILNAPTAGSEMLPQSTDHTPRQIHELDNRPQSPVAVLTESQPGYRIASSRPSRVLPVNASRSSQAQGKLPINSKYFKQKFLLYRGTERQETSPFRVFASCQYYVIALRHIIR